MVNIDGASHSSRRKARPATTLEGREDQLIALSVDLAEKQLREGKASSQVITHFLKLGTTRERLEQEKLRQENEVLKAKAEALASAKRYEELVGEALEAMRSYKGYEVQDED